MAKKYSLEEIPFKKRRRIAENTARHFDKEENRGKVNHNEIKELLKVLVARDRDGKRYYNEKKEAEIIKKFKENKNFYPKEVSKLIDSSLTYSDTHISPVLVSAITGLILLAGSYLGGKIYRNDLIQKQLERLVIEHMPERKDLSRKIIEATEENEIMEEEMQKKFYIAPPFKNENNKKSYVVTSGYWSVRNYGGPENKKERIHGALDLIPNSSDYRVCSVRNGLVVETGYRKDYGNFVRISHGKKHETLSAHLKEIHVERGDFVNVGDIIGIMGSSGRTRSKNGKKGVHLHLELLELRNSRKRKLNPLIRIKGYEEVLAIELKKSQLEFQKYNLEEEYWKMRSEYDSIVNYINSSDLISLFLNEVKREKPKKKSV